MATSTIEIPARVSEIKRVQEAASKAAAEAGFDDRTIYACQLAICEACENIIVHGYGPDTSGGIHVSFHPQPGELTIEVRDQAAPFDPAEVGTGRPHEDEDPPVGGLGLVILHRVMDEVSYQRQGEENLLTLRKVVPDADD